MSTNERYRGYLPETGNYFDLVEGDAYHTGPIAFHEFLSKEDSEFFFSDDFFQIPQYEQEILEMERIPDYAREAVRRLIFDEFEDRLLGMQDYRRWGKRFKQKCIDLTVPFWAQVNMESIMTAPELETDESTTTRSNTTQHNNAGEQKSETDQSNAGSTTGKQLTDSSTRTANLTAVAANDIVNSDMKVEWPNAADDFGETRTRAGDTSQESNSSGSSTTKVINNNNATTTNIATDSSEYTNKQFMQERRYAIETAQGLMPRAWLRAQLAGMFYLLR